jgi:hypothetical protein
MPAVKYFTLGLVIREHPLLVLASVAAEKVLLK